MRSIRDSAGENRRLRKEINKLKASQSVEVASGPADSDDDVDDPKVKEAMRPSSGKKPDQASANRRSELDDSRRDDDRSVKEAMRPSAGSKSAKDDDNGKKPVARARIK